MQVSGRKGMGGVWKGGVITGYYLDKTYTIGDIFSEYSTIGGILRILCRHSSEFNIDLFNFNSV